MTDFLPPVVMKLAADISEYVAKLAEADAALQTFIQGQSGHLENAVGEFAREGEKAGQAFEDAVPRAAQETGQRVAQDVSNRLRNAKGQFVADGEQAGKDVAGGIASGLQKAAQAVSNSLGSGLKSAVDGAKSAFSGLTSAIGTVSTVMFSMPSLILAGVGAIGQLGPVVDLAVASLAALPGVAMAAGGALSTLMLGFHGLGAALSAVFQPATGSAAQTANQLAQAEWNLQQAQKQAVVTQQAINDARKAAAQNIKDLALAMDGANLHIKEAELAVKDADKAYRAAFATGNQDAIYRASLNLQQAQLNLADAQNNAAKTADQKTIADKKGVEQSTQVVAAVDANANAVHALQQAQIALHQAQIGASGSASALAQAMRLLAPAAREVVQEVIRLKPEITGLQQAVQQHMFAGLAGDLDHLAHTVLPVAKAGLSGIADSFNQMFRGVAQGMSSPAFTGAMTTVFGSFAKVMGQFAALAPQAITAFSQLASAATPFLASLGGGAATALSHFLDFINKVSSNGELTKFFSIAAQAAHDLGGMLHDVASVLGSVFQAMGQGSVAFSVLGVLLHQVAEFFKSTQGAQALQAIFQVLGQVAGFLGSAIGGLLPILGKLLTALGPALQPIINLLTSQFLPIVLKLVGKLADALVPVINALSPALDKVLTALMPLLDMLGGALGDILVALAPVIAQLVTQLGDQLTAALTALTPVFKSLLPVLVTLIQQLLPALMPLLLMGGKNFLALMPILTPLIKLLVDILVPILKLLTPVLVVVADVLGIVAQALTAVITPIADFIGWLLKALDSASFWKGVGKWFQDLWHDIVGAFKDGIHWVHQTWDDMISFAEGIPGRILHAIGDLGSLLWNAGKDVVKGLWNGIVSMGDWLKNTIMGWVKDVIPGPIAKALGINSPSTVAADLAEQVPAGVVVGINRGNSSVAAAASRLATAMLPGVGTIGAIGLPNYTPTPVQAQPLAPVGAGQPGGGVVEVHVHNHTKLILDGREIHAALIPVAQQYRINTGTTGLETPKTGPGVIGR